MARTPQAESKSQPRRKAIRVRFEGENDGDKVKPDKTWSDADSEVELLYDDSADISQILRGLNERQFCKKSTWLATFQAQNNAMYAATRKDAKDLSQQGTQFLDILLAARRSIKKQEQNLEDNFLVFEKLILAQEAAIESLQSTYPPLLEESGHQRSDQVNAVSEMLKANQSRRQSALKKFSKNAFTRVEEVRETERIASDASALIKRYKGLLYA